MEDYKILCKMLMEYDNEISKNFNLQKKFSKTWEAKNYISDVLCQQNTHIFFDKNHFGIIQNLNLFLLVIALYVCPKKRKKGIGTELINRLKLPIIVECYKDNKNALKFYKKLNFHKVGTSKEKNFYWLCKGNMDEILLAKHFVKFIDRARGIS